MKRRIAGLLAAVMMLSSVTAFAAEVIVSEAGIYQSADNEETVHTGPAPLLKDSLLYLPVCESLNSVGIPAAEQNGEVYTANAVLRADSDVITLSGKDYIAMRTPFIHEGVVYADAPLLQWMFGITTQHNAKEGKVTIRYNDGSQEAENEEYADESWYDELVPQETDPYEGMSSLEIVIEHVRESVYNKTGNPYVIYNQMSPSGAFPDLPFDGSGNPATHIDRLASMCGMVYCEENPYYNDPVIKEAIAKSAKYWMRLKPTSTGWWQNVVGIPQAWQNFALFEPEGIEDIWDDILVYCQGEVWGGNGDSSRPWVLNDPLAAAQQKLRPYTGSGPGPGERIGVTAKLLATMDATDEEKDQLMHDCAAGMSIEMAYMSPRVAYLEQNDLLSADSICVQADSSYHEHGNSLMNGAYGAHYLQTVASVLNLFHGTHYRVTDEAANKMADYLIDGWQWSWYNGELRNYWLPNTVGRGDANGETINRDSAMALRVINYYTVLMERLLQDYGDVLQRKDELQDAVNHLCNPTQKNMVGNRYFWVSDHFVHHREDWSYTVLAPSPRMRIQETLPGNGDTLLFKCIGPSHLLVEGYERSYLAAQNNNYMPGTTVESDYWTLNPDDVVDKKNQSELTGGVSDGMYGAGMCYFDSNMVNAVDYKRSWFCFDDEVVCLGSDIRGKTGNPVKTTVDQAVYQGEIKTGSATTSETKEPGTYDISSSTWVLKDSVGYVLPDKNPKELDFGERTGDFYDLYKPSFSPGTMVTADIFLLTLDHGASPEGGSYEYTILPVTTEEELKAYAAEPKIVTLANDSSVQAVWHKELKILQAAFYEGGSVTTPDGLTLSVDNSCIVMVRLYDDGSYSIHAADPEQREIRTNISVSGTINQSLDFAFQQHKYGWYAGKTMHWYSSEGTFKDIETYNPNARENPEYGETARLEAVAVNGELYAGFKTTGHLYYLGTFEEEPEIQVKSNYRAQVTMYDGFATVTVTDPDHPENSTTYCFSFDIKNDEKIVECWWMPRGRVDGDIYKDAPEGTEIIKNQP